MNKSRNIAELKVKIKELETKLENAKGARSVPGYGVALYYSTNEKYIEMLEVELVGLLNQLPQNLG